jgi:hypothetical protein
VYLQQGLSQAIRVTIQRISRAIYGAEMLLLELVAMTGYGPRTTLDPGPADSAFYCR